MQFYQKMYQRIRCFLGRRKQALYDNFLFYWLLYGKSQVMTPSQKSALVFAPHQDDETLGCGGIIVIKSNQNIPVSVVFMTNGQASHRHHPTLQPAELGKLRKQEALEALGILGVEPANIHFLDRPDSQLAQLTPEKRQQLITELVQLLHTINPQEVYVTYRQDANADHEATYALVKEAILNAKIKVELLQYPVWCLWQPQKFNFQSPELSNVYKLSVKKVLERKKQALVVYKSQYLPVNNYNKTPLPPGFLSRFSSSYEIFFKV